MYLHVVASDLQAWLAPSNLLLMPVTRGHYDLDGPRTASLMRLRRVRLQKDTEDTVVHVKAELQLVAGVHGNRATYESHTDMSAPPEQVPLPA